MMQFDVKSFLNFEMGWLTILKHKTKKTILKHQIGIRLTSDLKDDRATITKMFSSK